MDISNIDRVTEVTSGIIYSNLNKQNTGNHLKQKTNVNITFEI
jgi:hypothetical protein